MNTSFRLTLGLLATCSAILLSACNALGTSETYQCPRGEMEGAHCMSAKEVYQATHGSDTVYGQPGSGKEKAGTPGEPQAVQASVIKSASPFPVPSADHPLPVRNPATILRGWIAPYEDASHDLIAGNYFYSEVRARTWTLGEEEISLVNGQVLKPLEGRTVTRQLLPKQKPDSGSGVAPSSSTQPPPAMPAIPRP